MAKNTGKDDLTKLRKELIELNNDELFALYREVAGYEEIPVDIMTFVEDNDYLGNFFGDSQFFPCWVEPLQEIYPNPYISPCNEIILTGSVGRGKTTTAIVGICYDIYRTLLIARPQELYGLTPLTTMCFHIFNATLKLTNDVVITQLRDIFSVSSFFYDQVRFAEKMRRKKKGSTLFPKNIDITVGSRAHHAMGKAVIGSLFDEVNFQTVVSDQAYKNYNTLTRRQESRFMQKGGMIPGHNWLCSSTDTELSFLQQHIETVKGNPTTFVYGGSIWDAQWHKGIYSGEWFQVFQGDENRDPAIVTKKSELKEYPKKLLVDVPVEHRKAFELDTTGALREFAGIAVGGTSRRLFTSVEKLNQAMVLDSYFNSDIVELSLEDDGDELYKHFQMSRYLQRRMNPGKPRYIHIDAGLSGDHLGLSSSYIAGYKSVRRMDDLTLSEETFKEPIIHIEYSISVAPKKGSQIPFYKIRRFLLQHLRKNGVPIKSVSTDGFESADMKQLISKSGVDTDYISCDRTTDPYIMLRNGINEGRILMSKNQVLKKECRELEIRSTGKRDYIDHPDGGSKDVADSAAGSVAGALKGKLSSTDMVGEIAAAIGSKKKGGLDLYNKILKGQIH